MSPNLLSWIKKVSCGISQSLGKYKVKLKFKRIGKEKPYSWLPLLKLVGESIRLPYSTNIQLV